MGGGGTMTARDIPVIFSAPMVHAHLADRKTMTRRLAKQMVKTYPNGRKTPPVVLVERDSPWTKVKVGDRLWVRESLFKHDTEGWRYRADKTAVTLQQDHPGVSAMIAWAHHKEGWSAPSLHMPRWASRITLVVTAVKIERLHDLSKEDAVAEGLWSRPADFDQSMLLWHWETEGGQVARAAGWENPRGAYFNLWERLHGRESYDANPYLIAIAYSVIKANIDAPEARAA
jgi:hypothetical protein